ncbi:MAG: hypothetical protein E6K54_08745 [Gammaproteobacteria bacterium]|nr:MAG: hypothetical protein E6K54_08745 [Gammaproteobacteria bacterium]
MPPLCKRLTRLIMRLRRLMKMKAQKLKSLMMDSRHRLCLHLSIKKLLTPR